jgi:hypothetical protein
MTGNPYAPPKAAVSDVAVAPTFERPRQVTRAVWLLWISLVVADLLSVANSAINGGVAGTPRLGFLLVLFPIGLLFAWWIYGKVQKGRNWARILLLIGVALAPLNVYVTLAKSLLADHRLLPLLVQVVPWPLNAWACWLLFTSPGKEWFRKRAG